MPRIAMDYTKVIIYHFVCQDPTQVSRYVGSTTNFIKRKAHHKCVCNKPTHKDYGRPIYQTIRDNGGWDNWEMKPLEEFPCENHIQQQIREQYWIDKLIPVLNQHKAHRTEEEYQQYQLQWRQDHPEYQKEYRKRKLKGCDTTLSPVEPTPLS